jgi:hypothetical protein
MPDELKIAPDPDRSFIPAISVALLLLVTVAVIVFFVNPREVDSLTVTGVDILAPHTEFRNAPGAMHVIGVAAGGEDNLYVVARIRMTDKLRLPLFILNATVTITNPDGSAVTATEISPRYYERLEKTFPALTPLLSQPVHDGDEIEPGQTEAGCILVNFPSMTESDWKARKSATLSINLRNQGPQTVRLN